MLFATFNYLKSLFIKKNLNWVIFLLLNLRKLLFNLAIILILNISFNNLSLINAVELKTNQLENKCDDLPSVLKTPNGELTSDLVFYVKGLEKSLYILQVWPNYYLFQNQFKYNSVLKDIDSVYFLLFNNSGRHIFKAKFKQINKFGNYFEVKFDPSNYEYLNFKFLKVIDSLGNVLGSYSFKN